MDKALDTLAMAADQHNALDRGFGVFTTDAELVVRTWDAWLAHVTGIGVAEACGRPLAALVPDLAARRLLPRFTGVLERGVVEVLAPAFHHYLVRCPPQTPSRSFDAMQQHVTIAPLREDERIVGTIVTIKDVTARLERERELAAQLASMDEGRRMQATHELAASDTAPHLLLDVLDDTSWQVRRAAVAGLAQHGGADEIATLLHALRAEHHNLNVLNSALQVLALNDIDTIPALVEFLHAADADLRIYAAQALGEQGDARSVDALLRALDDPDTNVRYHAVEALGKLRASAAVDRLVEIVEERDFFLGFAALDALAAIGDARSAPRIVPLLADVSLREPAANALGRLGDIAVIPPLVQLLNTADAPTLAICRALASFYTRYQDSYHEGLHIADLVRRGITLGGVHNVLNALPGAQGDDLRQLVLVLGWLHGAAVDRALVQLLGQPDVRREVIEACVRAGSRVTDLLIEQLATDDLETRGAAIVGLGRIGDKRAVPALLAILGSEPELVIPAVDALAKLGDRRAFDALLPLLGHPAGAVRQAAVAAINSLGHPKAPEHAAALLVDPDARLRESAVKIAGYFGFTQCLDALFERCQDIDERVRVAAVEHLPYLEDARAAAALRHALLHDTPKVRAAAARAAAMVDGAEGELLAALGDSDAWVRYFAIRGLAQQQYAPAFELLAQIAQSDPAQPVRIAAIHALGQLGNEQAVSVLIPCTTAGDPDLARAALAALGQLQQPSAQQALLARLQAPEVMDRIVALQELSPGHSGEIVRAIQWIAASDHHREVRQAAIETLGRQATEDAAEALVALLADPEQRPLSTAALVQFGEQSLGVLARRMVTSDPSIRAALVEVLARIKRPAATAIIIEALDDPHAAIRLAAIQALSLLGSIGAEHKLADLAERDVDLTARRAAQAALQH